jgi:Ca2+-binding RTX toxin-like protein
VLKGGAGNDTLSASKFYAYNTTYEGGKGDDTITATTNADTYLFGRGDGKDAVAESGGADMLGFGDGLVGEDIWFRRVGQALEVSVIGTRDSVTFAGWYDGASQQVERFETSDGHAMTVASVNALVSAMASFSPPAEGQTTLPDDYRTQLAPIIASSWI